MENSEINQVEYLIEWSKVQAYSLAFNNQLIISNNTGIINSLNQGNGE